jgi:hypothetical protein
VAAFALNYVVAKDDGKGGYIVDYGTMNVWQIDRNFKVLALHLAWDA